MITTTQGARTTCLLPAHQKRAGKGYSIAVKKSHDAADVATEVDMIEFYVTIWKRVG